MSKLGFLCLIVLLIAIAILVSEYGLKKGGSHLSDWDGHIYCSLFETNKRLNDATMNMHNAFSEIQAGNKKAYDRLAENVKPVINKVNERLENVIRACEDMVEYIEKKSVPSMTVVSRPQAQKLFDEYVRAYDKGSIEVFFDIGKLIETTRAKIIERAGKDNSALMKNFDEKMTSLFKKLDEKNSKTKAAYDKLIQVFPDMIRGVNVGDSIKMRINSEVYRKRS